MPLLSNACVPLSAKDLRTSNLAGHIIFNVNEPQSVLQKRLFDISTKCLYGESGVVSQSFDKEAGTSNINFAFTDAGYYLNTVTIDLVNLDDAKTSDIDTLWAEYQWQVASVCRKSKRMDYAEDRGL